MADEAKLGCIWGVKILAGNSQKRVRKMEVAGLEISLLQRGRGLTNITAD